MLFAVWGVEFGKMEACLARLNPSLATPGICDEKRGLPLNRLPLTRSHSAGLYAANPPSIDRNMQQPSRKMG